MNMKGLGYRGKEIWLIGGKKKITEDVENENFIQWMTIYESLYI